MKCNFNLLQQHKLLGLFKYIKTAWPLQVSSSFLKIAEQHAVSICEIMLQQSHSVWNKYASGLLCDRKQPLHCYYTMFYEYQFPWNMFFCLFVCVQERTLEASICKKALWDYEEESNCPFVDCVYRLKLWSFRLLN